MTTNRAQRRKMKVRAEHVAAFCMRMAPKSRAMSPEAAGFRSSFVKTPWDYENRHMLENVEVRAAFCLGSKNLVKPILDARENRVP